MKILITAAMLAAMATASHAGVLAVPADGQFGVTLTEDGSTPLDFGPFGFQSGVGDCDSLSGGSACDAEFQSIFGTLYTVDWTASNVVLIGFDSTPPPSNTTISLTGLDFVEGVSMDIINATFNANGPHATFLFNPDDNPFSPITNFIDPTVSFTANSVDITLFTTDEFGGDAPQFEFILEMAPSAAAVVPLPAAGWALLAGIAALFGVRRRQV